MAAINVIAVMCNIFLPQALPVDRCQLICRERTFLFLCTLRCCCDFSLALPKNLGFVALFGSYMPAHIFIYLCIPLDHCCMPPSRCLIIQVVFSLFLPVKSTNLLQQCICMLQISAPWCRPARGEWQIFFHCNLLFYCC